MAEFIKRETFPGETVFLRKKRSKKKPNFIVLEKTREFTKKGELSKPFFVVKARRTKKRFNKKSTALKEVKKIMNK